MGHRLREIFERFRQKKAPPPVTPIPSAPGRPRPGGALEGHGMRDAAIGDVEVSYEPMLDGDPDPGEVVWTWVPFEEDPTQGKDRPVVVIGRTGRYLAGVALTTKGHHYPDNLEMGTGPWDPQQRESYAKLDRVLRIDPSQVRREGSILDAARFDRLISALQARGAS